MKKIGVYLGCHPYGGGIFQYCLTILDALKILKDENKLDVYIFHDNFDWSNILATYGFKSKQAPKYFFHKVIFKLWRIFHFPISPIRWIFSKTHPLIKELKNQNCNAWIFPSQDQWPILINDFFTIGTVHDLMHIYESRFPEVGNASELKYRNFLYSNLCKYADIILTDSNLGKLQIIENYNVSDSSKIIPLHYTIPDKLINILPDLDVLKKRSIDDSFFIFYPAQFWKHKNHILLLQAYLKVCETYPNLKLVFSGSTKNGSIDIDNFIKNNKLENKVVQLGYISDEELAGLYLLAKALVMPTFFGPTNIPPLEANFFECPVIYSNIYAYSEIPVPMEPINPSDPDSIANGIKNVLSSNTKPLKTLNHKENFKYMLGMIIEKIGSDG